MSFSEMIPREAGGAQGEPHLSLKQVLPGDVGALGKPGEDLSLGEKADCPKI